MSDAHAFLAAEQAKTAAEQALRRKHQTDARNALARVRERERKLAAVKLLEVKPEPVDPWEKLLRNMENRQGVYRLYNSNGDLEVRVRSRHIMMHILCLSPERLNGSTQGPRIARLMRSLGWSGPKDMRFAGKLRGKGYSRIFPNEQLNRQPACDHQR